MKWFPVLLVCLSFQAQAQCEFTEVNIETSTGEWGEEMSWTLYQSPEIGGAFPLASFQGQFDGTTTSQTLCLEDGCYFFLASDSWGDGWNGGEISCNPALEGFMEPFTLDNRCTRALLSQSCPRKRRSRGTRSFRHRRWPLVRGSRHWGPCILANLCHTRHLLPETPNTLRIHYLT